MINNYTFDENWTFQEKYLPQIQDILMSYAYLWSSPRLANFREDTKKATDAVGESVPVSFAVRIRRPGYDSFKDLTIRCYNRGFKTERDKLKSGHGDYYLYAWTGPTGKIIDYWLIDIHAIRSSGLLDKKNIKYNRGGNTAFISITKQELEKAGALLVGN